MGNRNCGPVTDKHVTEGKNAQFKYACCEMQGWRDSMEDASICNEYFTNNSSLFGIFDGHGGHLISKFASSNFEDIFKSCLDKNKEDTEMLIENSLIQTFVKLDELLYKDEVNNLLRSLNNQYNKSHVDDDLEFDMDFNVNNYRNNKSRSSNISSISSNSNNYINTSSNNNSNISGISDKNLVNDSLNESSTNYTKAYNEAIEIYEKKYNNNKTEDLVSTNTGKISDLLKKKDLIAKYMGTTANIVYIDASYVYVANVGDSFAVMYKNKKAIKLNTEHKTSLMSEEERIYKAGLTVVNNRVEGKLNLTRALGDLCFKTNKKLKAYEQAVTCYPEISKYKLTEDVEFIIMGCDGIWDCVDIQKFCDQISLDLKNSSPCQVISNLMDKILSKTKECPIGTDNMTCTLVVFNDKK